MPNEFVEPKSVSIKQNRWNVIIVVVDSQGDRHEFVASADSFFTQQSSIWFSTRAEYDQALKEG